MATPKKNKRLPKYRRDPNAFGNIEVTDRDREILDLVYRYRYVRAEHVYALTPGGEDAGGRRQLAYRLQGLYHHGYVQRLVPPSRMSLAGSPKMVYALDSRGAKEIARKLYDANVGELAWRSAHSRRMEWFIEHHTGISDFHAALERALGRGRGVELGDWQQGVEVRGECEWKRAAWGGSRIFRVSPDAFFATEDGGVRRNFFLEFDRGSEEPRRIRRMFENYAWYLQSPAYRKAYERADDVRVLVVVDVPAEDDMDAARARADRRRARMMDCLEEIDVQGAQPGWFWFTTADEYHLAEPERILGPIWLTVKNRARTLALFK